MINFDEISKLKLYAKIASKAKNNIDSEAWIDLRKETQFLGVHNNDDKRIIIDYLEKERNIIKVAPFGNCSITVKVNQEFIDLYDIGGD